MTTKISLALFLTLAFGQIIASQDAGLPPLGADAIEHLGSVVSKYDKFTDKSKLELALQVKGTFLNGVFFTAVCVYSGQVVPTNAKVVLGLAVVGDEYRYEKNNKIIFLVDGERQVYDPQRFPLPMSNGKGLELLLIPREFSAGELVALAGARRLEGRLGSYDEFEIGSVQRATLKEFVDKMRGASEALGYTPSVNSPIELPSNFRYRRELGEQTGLPFYTLMPDEDAMAADAEKGNVFQALGVMAQPTANKFGLALINAQTQYQLHINQSKGAYLTLGKELIHIPEYQILLRKEIGKLKMETAAITISNEIFSKLLKSDQITVQCGSVIYELDQDNIDALKYLAQQIGKDAKSLKTIR